MYPGAGGVAVFDPVCAGWSYRLTPAGNGPAGAARTASAVHDFRCIMNRRHRESLHGSPQKHPRRRGLFTLL